MTSYAYRQAIRLRRLAIGYKAKGERCGLAAPPLITLLAEEQKSDL